MHFDLRIFGYFDTQSGKEGVPRSQALPESLFFPEHKPARAIKEE